MNSVMKKWNYVFNYYPHLLGTFERKSRYFDSIEDYKLISDLNLKFVQI